MGKPRGGNHWIYNHLVKATRYRGSFTEMVKKEVTIEVLKMSKINVKHEQFSNEGKLRSTFG